MKPTLSVIAPCYNEEGNLAELVDRLLAVFDKREISGQVVLVNDGSSDGTGAEIERLSDQHERVVGVHHAVNQGIEAGWRSGLAASKGDYVCIIDADLQYLPEDVGRLYRELQNSGADLVQGVRSSIGRSKDNRYTLSIGLNVLLNSLFKMHLRDNKSGFILCRREVFADILSHRYDYAYFQSLITVAANARGYSIREVETLFNSRLVGESFIAKFPFKVISGVLVDLGKAFVEYRLVGIRTRVLGDFLAKHPVQEKEETLPGWRRQAFNFYVSTLPLHHWNITRRAADYYHELKKTQWLAPAQVRELQELRLQKLVDHAYRHVGYYRETFDRLGLRPRDVRTIEDLQKLPLLGKDDVREHLYFDLLSDNHNKADIHQITTSGSTGEPFICYVDTAQLEMRWASTQRSAEWTGYRFGDRQARLWHQTIGMSQSQAFKEKLAARLSRRLFIPAFELTDERLEKFIRELAAYNPVLIDGYAESFNFLAHYVREHGIPPFRPRAIISSAQSLPAASRRIIEEQFGCQVFDKYGSREFSGIAYECQAHQGHHVVAESYIVEILKGGKPAAPGEMGEVVITDLNNYCMPFIRYRVGDLAVAVDPDEVCSCGRGLPRIGDIEGRVQAIIVGANGTYVPGTFFAHLIKDYHHVVRHFQILQEKAGAVRFLVVRGPRYSDSAFEEIVDLIREYLGRTTDIQVEYVEEIPLGRTGKRHHSISKIGMDFQQLSQDLGVRTKDQIDM
ncbi:MAG: glycosyltransferase [Vulcanimicrobiota bacterium]